MTELWCLVLSGGLGYRARVMAAESQSGAPLRPEPVFNTFCRQPLRPFYSLRETQIGFAILCLLAGVVGWVMWRGMHPDPDLFAVEDALLTAKGASVPVYERPIQPWIEPGTAVNVAAPAGLGPFPPAVTADGWQVVGAPQMFDAATLYEKINGREGYYKSFGFQKLHCLALRNGEFTIDIELFDQGNVANALGALAGEISSPSAEVQATPTGLWYLTRNGGFLAQGKFYARLIGSDEDPVIRGKIAGLREALSAALPGESLPWAYELLVGTFGVSPAVVQYQKENAFSFGFATEFYSAIMPGGETEIFVSRRANAADAASLAGKLQEGFLGFGKLTNTGLVHNEMINAYDGVRAAGEYVIGVRLAPTPAEGLAWLEKLAQAVAPPPANAYE